MEVITWEDNTGKTWKKSLGMTILGKPHGSYHLGEQYWENLMEVIAWDDNTGKTSWKRSLGRTVLGKYHGKRAVR
jgi:hypothetical protein